MKLEIDRQLRMKKNALKNEQTKQLDLFNSVLVNDGTFA